MHEPSYTHVIQNQVKLLLYCSSPILVGVMVS